MAETHPAGLKQTPAGLSQQKHSLSYSLIHLEAVQPPLNTPKFLMTDPLKTGKWWHGKLFKLLKTWHHHNNIFFVFFFFLSNPTGWISKCDCSCMNSTKHNFHFTVSPSQAVYLQQLLACVDVLLHQCESDCGAVSLQLLQVLISIQSLSAEPQLSARVRTPCSNLTSPDFKKCHTSSSVCLFFHSSFTREVSRFYDTKTIQGM